MGPINNNNFEGWQSHAMPVAMSTSNPSHGLAGPPEAAPAGFSRTQGPASALLTRGRRDPFSSSVSLNDAASAPHKLWKASDVLADKEGERATVFYTTGHQYNGSWHKNHKHGLGTHTYPNGDRYEGEWADGLRHGSGTYWKREDSKYRVRYTGEWENDVYSGRGVYYNAKGERYEGQWLNGKRNGKGRQTYGGRFDGLNADVYEGDWVDNQRSGVGTLFYANGDMYEGNWLANEKHGTGSFYYVATHKRYDGVWKEGTPTAGTYTSADPGWRPSAEAPHIPVIELVEPELVANAAKAEARMELGNVKHR